MIRTLELKIESGDSVCNPEGEPACRNLIRDETMVICRLFRSSLVKGEEGVKRHHSCLQAEKPA
jgi:hypothetical protein